MTVQELEEKVWAMDGVRIVVRAPGKKKVADYTQKNAAQANWSITEFTQKRLAPLLADLEVVVLMGDGEQPHGRTMLRSIRDSYRGK